MSKLMIQVAGRTPILVAEGSRQAIGSYSVSQMAKTEADGVHVQGVPFEWFGTKNGKPFTVWVEPSSTWLAEAPIPDYCKAPEGAPQC